MSVKDRQEAVMEYMQLFESKNMEYMPEKLCPHLTYVYNKYSKAKFNCV